MELPKIDHRIAVIAADLRKEVQDGNLTQMQAWEQFVAALDELKWEVAVEFHTTEER